MITEKKTVSFIKTLFGRFLVLFLSLVSSDLIPGLAHKTICNCFNNIDLTVGLLYNTAAHHILL